MLGRLGVTLCSMLVLAMQADKEPLEAVKAAVELARREYVAEHAMTTGGAHICMICVNDVFIPFVPFTV